MLVKFLTYKGAAKYPRYSVGTPVVIASREAIDQYVVYQTFPVVCDEQLEVMTLNNEDVELVNPHSQEAVGPWFFESHVSITIIDPSEQYYPQPLPVMSATRIDSAVVASISIECNDMSQVVPEYFESALYRSFHNRIRAKALNPDTVDASVQSFIALLNKPVVVAKTLMPEPRKAADSDF